MDEKKKAASAGKNDSIRSSRMSACRSSIRMVSMTLSMQSRSTSEAEVGSVRARRSVVGWTIGKNCIVAAGSVVNRDVPDNCIVAGVPAKVLRKLDEQDRMQVWDTYMKNEVPLSERESGRSRS